MSRKKKKYPVGFTMCYEIINCKVVDGIGSVYGDTGWYLVVLGQYMLVLVGIRCYRVSIELLCLHILKQVEISAGVTDASQTD